MKKLKTAFLLICCLFSSLIFFACGDKTIKVDSITLNSYDIVLREGESFDLNVNVGPNNATNKGINYVLTDSSVVTLQIDEEDETKATLIASEEIIGPMSTFLQVVSEDGNARSNIVKITVYTEKVQLATPLNLEYNSNNQLITWDNVDASSGYKLYIEIEGEQDEEVNCATNSYKIDEYFDKIISVKVKSIGDGIVYTDSQYSESTFKFIQLEEPKNLRNEGKFIKFDKVPNAENYKIFVYEVTKTGQKLVYEDEFSDAGFNAEIGYTLDLLENAGKTYIVKVQTIAKDFVGVTEYPSKINNSITITKIATPEVSGKNFRFTYNTKTLSWENETYATGYVVTRMGEGETKIYELDSDTNYLTIDTQDDKLEAGKYYYTLQILGNNKDYLNSNYSDAIELEKLSAPQMSVSNGKIVWTAVDNIGKYILGIDGQTPSQIEKETTEFSLGSAYSAGQHSFIIASVGNGINTITSEFSEVFKAEKLARANKPNLKDNKDLIFSGVSYIDLLNVYITLEDKEVYTRTLNDLTLETIDENTKIKTVSIDMSTSQYNSGNYKAYAVAYAEGYLAGEPSETFEFAKLKNTQTVSITKGELSHNLNLVENASKVELYLRENNETTKVIEKLVFEDGKYKIKFYKAENEEVEYSLVAGQDYYLYSRYIPELNSNYVISNFTSEFKFSKLPTPQLSIECGEINFKSTSTVNPRFNVQAKNDIEINTYSNLTDIKLLSDTIYTIKMYHYGDSQYLNGDYSNVLQVKLLDEILDLKLSGDTISFSDIGASVYYAHLKTNEGIVKDYAINLKNKTSFVLSDFIKTQLPDSYNNLFNTASVYVTYQGGDNPEGLGSIITYLDREVYANGLYNKSNEIQFKLLSSPTNLKVTSLSDLVNKTIDTSIEINRMYFDCMGNSNMFELKYKNLDTGVELSKILTLNNGLSIHSQKDGVITYLVNTDFLSSGSYNFEIRAVTQSKAESIPEKNNIIYIIDSLDTASLSGIIKLEAVDSISCINNQIVINDDDTANTNSINSNDFVYLLTINGKTIYDDILGEGKDLDYIIGLTSNLSTAYQAWNLIQEFKSTTRTIPEKYTNAFSVNVYKLLLPTLSIDLLNQSFSLDGGIALQSSLTNPITVERIKAPSLTLKNGFVEWTPVENAEKYIISIGEIVNSVCNYLPKIEINSASNVYKFNLYEHLNGKPGNYVVSITAQTNIENYLSSNPSSVLDFEILEAPTFIVESGKLKWNKVNNCAGYELKVYKGNDTSSNPDTLQIANTILEYDCMLDSYGNIINSGNYTFVIKALGQLDNNEESSVMTSLSSDSHTATKLDTPIAITLLNGKLVLTRVNNGTGVDYYKLNVNESVEEIQFSSNSFELELAEKYNAGDYIFSYQAIGTGNYLTSNVSVDTSAKKLEPTSKIYIYEGEIYWQNVTAENYNNEGQNIKYDINVKQSQSVKNFDTISNSYYISQDNDIASGLYTFEVKSIGDSYNYLNSNIAKLENLVKLDSIHQCHVCDNTCPNNCENVCDENCSYKFRIEDGKLAFTSPKIVAGTQNGTLASPNGLCLTITNSFGEEEIEILEDGTEIFALLEKYQPDTYVANIYNIGNEGDSTNGYNFVNSKIIEFVNILDGYEFKQFVKLKPITDLNINDGINLAWTDNNQVSPTKKFIVNITQNIDENSVDYSGILFSHTSSIEFQNICYYINEKHERILILKDDSEMFVNTNDNKYYYRGYEVKYFEYRGSFDVSVYIYGDTNYITSDVSNTINITPPSPVENLKVEHGKITWSPSQDANGYIVKLSRTDLDGIIDEEFNKLNERIYLANQTYYNLPDVNYKYFIGVRAYALSIDDENSDKQYMASIEKSIEDYVFNSFIDGNGSDENPYIIDSKDTLKLINYNHFATYKIIEEIEFSNNEYFVPQFSQSNPFVGKIIGNNKTINNLKIVQYKRHSGMLGYISKETIIDDRAIYNQTTDKYERTKTTKEYEGYVENLIFDNININVGVFVGAIAGYNEGVLSNITVSGQMVSTSEIEADAGVSKESVYSGGLVGQNKGIIINSTNNAKIAPSASTALYSGGISAVNAGLIYNCINNGKVEGTLAGGIVAINSTEQNFAGDYVCGKIEACKATSNITCYNFKENQTTLEARAGGIAAINEQKEGYSSIITNCIVNNAQYAETGSGITNTSTEKLTTIYMGGLVGENYGVCHNNFVKIKLNTTNPLAQTTIDTAAMAGKIIGYNNGMVTYNYCLAGAQADAESILANGYAVGNTNVEITTFNASIIENLNNEKNNENITWQLSNNNNIDFVVID